MMVLCALNSPACVDFCGALEWTGCASAQLNVPRWEGMAGTTMHFAYCLGNPFDFVSNPVAIEIVP